MKLFNRNSQPQIIENNIQGYNRIQYLDMVRLFAIYCVLWGHSLQYVSAVDFISNDVVKFIYSFHMPLFMVLSGYFFSSVLRISFFKVSIKKIRQLILPIVSWAVLMEIIFSIYSLYNSKTIEIVSLLKNISTNVGLNFWFLKSLFFCYILAYLLVKLINIDWLACLVSLLICALNPNVFQL